MISLKSPDEIEAMAHAGTLLTEVMQQLLDEIGAGLVNTYDIDQRAEKLINERGATPAFMGYRQYPATICISINSEVVHGTPSPKRLLKPGDIASLDVGLVYQGWYSDMAESFIVGGPKKNPTAHKLITTARESLALAIRQARPGKTIGDISAAVQKHVEHNGFGVVRELVGHGIGRELHEEPQVPNFTSDAKAVPLKAGTVLAIEPMITLGDWHVVTAADGWTVETVDHSLAAHVERTVAITDQGPRILTPLSLRA